MEQPIADIVNILEGPGKGATSAKHNDRFRGLLNSINVLENRAKARRRALLMVGVRGVGGWVLLPSLISAAFVGCCLSPLLLVLVPVYFSPKLVLAHKKEAGREQHKPRKSCACLRVRALVA